MDWKDLMLFGGMALAVGIALVWAGWESQQPDDVTSIETADGTCYLWHNGYGSDMECRWSTP